MMTAPYILIAPIKNGGKLNNGIKQPRFLADPTHRIKVMSKVIFSMLTNTKDLNKCKGADALRIKRYLGYCIRQNCNKDLMTFKKSCNAPLEHLFGNHSHCDPQWCWAKEISDASFKYLLNLNENRKDNDEIQSSLLKRELIFREE